MQHEADQGYVRERLETFCNNAAGFAAPARSALSGIGVMQ
jgi:hypothetical protein